MSPVGDLHVGHLRRAVVNRRGDMETIDLLIAGRNVPAFRVRYLQPSEPDLGRGCNTRRGGFGR